MAVNAARQRFIDEYLAAPANAAEAARRAGYSPRRAKETACELLKLPEVRSLARERLSERLLALCESARTPPHEVIRAVRQLALLHGLYPCQCAVRKAPGRTQGPGTKYYWSARLRRNNVVSNWSQFSFFKFMVFAAKSGQTPWFGFSTPLVD